MLVDSTVLVKTAKGQLEIEQRACGLGLALRRVLILVDGRRTCGEFRSGLGASLEAPQALSVLIDEGFVEPVPRPADQQAGARAELMALITSALGSNAARVLPIFERSVDSPEALEIALVSAAKLVRLTIDERKADSLLAGGKSLLKRYR